MLDSPKAPLDDIISDFLKRSIISKEFAEKVRSQGIDAQEDGTGRSLLHYAALKGELSSVESIMALGALFLEDNSENSPFLVGVNHIEITKYFLKNLKEQDILAINKEGKNAFHLAAIQNQFEVLELLLVNGRFKINSLDNRGNTPLMSAAMYGRVETVEYLLQKDNSSEIAYNYEKMNALHLAAESKNKKIVDILIKEKRFKETIWDQDLYQRTALYFAEQHSFPESIKIALGKSSAPKITPKPKTSLLTRVFVSKQPATQKEVLVIPQLNNLDQTHLNYLLAQYLRLTGRKPEEILEPGGNCNGWSFLFLLYRSAGKIDKFYDILNTISTWDMSKDIKDHQLPASLKRKYENNKDLYNQYLSKDGIFKNLNKKEIEELNSANIKNVEGLLKFFKNKSKTQDPKYKEICDEIFGKYIDAKDLFEQTVNDLVLFQWATDQKPEALPGAKTVAGEKLGQYSRSEQLDFIQSNFSERVVKTIFEFSGKIDIAQLAEYLNMFSTFAPIGIDIGGSAHSTCIYITEDGKFEYYDSNHKNKIPPFSNTRDLAQHIYNTKFRALGKLKEPDKMSIQINVQKFYNSPRDVPMVEKASKNISYPETSPNGFTKLHYAILQNDSAKVEKALKENPGDFFKKDIYGVTPLQMARIQKKDNIINSLLLNEKLWIKHKDNINNISAFQYAIELDNKVILKAILEQKIQDVCSSKNLDKPDEDGKTLLLHALEYGLNSKLITNLIKLDKDGRYVNIQGKDGFNALMLAASLGKSDIIKSLMGLKYNVNQQNAQNDKRTALIYAIAGNHLEVVEMLLKSGADLTLADSDGVTPLMYAIGKSKDLNMVKLLVQYKADINAISPDGTTPLIYAVAQPNNHNVVKYLSETNKIDINYIDEEDNSALKTAIENNSIEYVELLLKAGALVALKNENGMSAMDFAKNIDEHEHEPGIMELLEDHQDLETGVTSKKAPKKTPTRPEPIIHAMEIAAPLKAILPSEKEKVQETDYIQAWEGFRTDMLKIIADMEEGHISIRDEAARKSIYRLEEPCQMDSSDPEESKKNIQQLQASLQGIKDPGTKKSLAELTTKLEVFAGSEKQKLTRR